MSRNTSILFGIGLASLALVGCSKNITGPEEREISDRSVAVDRQAALDRRALVRLPVPREEPQLDGDQVSRLDEAEVIGGKMATADADRLSFGRLQGRPVAPDQKASTATVKGRLIALDGDIF